MGKRVNLAGDARLYLSKDEMLDFQLGRTLAYQYFGGATNGEVARFMAQFRDRGETREAWVQSWTELGRLCRSLGRTALAASQRRLASSLFLRSYNYLRAAEFFFDRVRCGNSAQADLYRESRECFDAAMDLQSPAPERISIPFESISLPGYFFKAKVGAEPAPTVIISGGGDGSGEELYFVAGVPEALARGLNVFVFHGLGQRGVLHQDPRYVFRPQAEEYFRLIVDYVCSRPDVRKGAIGLYGLSFGGYLTPRAAAFDERIRALVPNAPIRDFYALITAGVLDQLPAALGRLPLGVLAPVMSQVVRMRWPMKAMVEQAMLWTSGASGIGDFFNWAKLFRLDGVEQNIRCPVLAVCGEGEGDNAKAQARAFVENVKGPAELVLLPANIGADSHCGVNNTVQTSAIVYDWLSTQLT